MTFLANKWTGSEKTMSLLNEIPTIKCIKFVNLKAIKQIASRLRIKHDETTSIRGPEYNLTAQRTILV